MKKSYVAFASLFIALLALTGCTVKNTEVTFDQNTDNGGVSVLVIKADGSNLTTETAQKADGDLSGVADVIKEAVDSLNPGDEALDAVETLTEPEALEDAPAGDVVEVE